MNKCIEFELMDIFIDYADAGEDWDKKFELLEELKRIRNNPPFHTPEVANTFAQFLVRAFKDDVYDKEGSCLQDMTDCMNELMKYFTNLDERKSHNGIDF
jgi:hypothetical protein